MCGIAGVIARNTISNVPACLSAMKAALGHRGPDDSGDLLHQLPGWTVGLAHTRLAILDLSSAGHQPMASAHRPLWITYNGEVYNFRELRGELSHSENGFVSSSDTEVILRAWEKWGAAALPRLRGMFAFGVWDEARRTLTLARDPVGIKPLYYYQNGDVFLFASEIRALLETGLIPRRTSMEGLVSYLEYGSVQGPLTIIEGIRSLAPGSQLQVRLSGGQLQVIESSFGAELFNEGSAPAVANRREAAAMLHDKLKESVRLHMVSDVPVGVFLSGGIDSASLIALMAQVSSARPKAYSVIFEEPEFSEATQAQYVARKFDADHHEIFLTDKALFDLLPSAFQAMDQPTFDGINTFVISKTVREAGITVAMSGLGGDELFGGYPSFRRARHLERLSLLPRQIRKAVSHGGRNLWNHSVPMSKFWDLFECDGSSRAAYDISRRVFSRREVAAMLPDVAPASPARYFENGCDRVNAVSRYEMEGYMTNTLLRDTDFMSMAHSLEVRVPFLDSEIVRFLMQVPGEWKLDGHRPKPLLLDALNGLVPERVWKRRKMGFTLPFERWMQSTLKPDLEEALSSDALFGGLGLRSDFIQGVWQSFTRSHRKERWARPWALFVLKKWCELNRVEL